MYKSKYLEKLQEQGIQVGILPKRNFAVEVGDTISLDIEDLPIGAIVTVVRVSDKEIIVYGTK